MTTFQLEAFLSLASTLNFTRSSGILNTTQPNLSKTIANLEQELDVQLFFRNKRDVRLTPAGNAFLGEAQKLMAQLEQAALKAKQAESGILGEIKVGFLGTALIHVLPSIVRNFHERHPKIRLELIDFTYPQLLSSLKEGKIDMALMPDRELGKNLQLSRRQLFSDSMCLVTQKSHPLAKSGRASLTSFAGEAFVVMDPKVSEEDFRLVAEICGEAGFEPLVARKANTLNSLMLLVECGEGISILAEHMAQFATENICFIPIEGFENYFRMSCVWREGMNPSLPFLLEVIDYCLPGA